MSRRAATAPTHCSRRRRLIAGDPAEIGIADLTMPDWGDPQEFSPGDVSVFWACGVTPKAVAVASKPQLMITHSPGHMFITDQRIDELPVRGT